MTANILSRFRLELTTLTPVHVGAGSEKELLRDYDFVPRGKDIWVMSVEKMLEAIPDHMLKRGLDPQIRNLVKDSDYEKCLAYKLALVGDVPRQIKEQMKDAHQRPYLPGSSLKGALRTAILNAHYAGRLSTEPFVDRRGERQEAVRWDSGSQHQLLGKKANAFQPIEKHYFGAEPHTDLFRALRVTDCSPTTEIRMLACQVVTYSIRGGRLVPGTRRMGPRDETLQVWVEAIPHGVVLSGELAIDNYTLDNPELSGFRGKEDWLRGIGAACRSTTEKLIAGEIQFCASYGLSPMADLYRTLERTVHSYRDKDDEFVLPLSWGAGWLAKTVGSRLSPEDRNTVARVYRLDRGRNAGIFPKTRRAVIIAGQRPGDPQPAGLLGWVKARLTPI